MVRGSTSVPPPLIAAALLALDHAAIVSFNCGGHGTTALSWTDRDTAWADAYCGAGASAMVPIVVVVAVPPDLNVDALGLNRSDNRSSRQHRCGSRHRN